MSSYWARFFKRDRQPANRKDATDSHEFALSQDVIGAFFVRNGTMKSNWYRRNHRHRLYTSDGFFKLPEALITRIKNDMIALSEKETGSTPS